MIRPLTLGLELVAVAVSVTFLPTNWGVALLLSDVEVEAAVTTNTKGTDVDCELLLSPEYVAVSAWLPTANNSLEKWKDALAACWAITRPLSFRKIVPVGVVPLLERVLTISTATSGSGCPVGALKVRLVAAIETVSRAGVDVLAS